VGVSEDGVLADWQRRALLIAFATLCIAAGFATLFRALADRSRKLEHQANELSRTAEALGASEARFRDYALTSSDWFWETDQHHRFTYVSDGIRNFGPDPATVMGRTRVEQAADPQADPTKWREHM